MFDLAGDGTVSEKNVTFAAAKNILKKREKEGELIYEQKATLDYLKKFSKGSEKDAEKKLEKLMEAGLKEEEAIQVIDFAPEDKDSLKLMLSKKRLSDADISKILKIVS